jgi:2'-5' RNA ligase
MLSLDMTNQDINSGQSYLQLFVSLDRRAGWYRAVKQALGRVRPQEGHFHITVAFIKDEIDLVGAKKVAEILDEELKGMTAPTLVFDTVDAFPGKKSGKSIVNLTASRVPEEWVAFVDRIRARLSGAGYDLGPYRLHVTLARVPIKSIGLEALQARLARIDVPKMSLTLTKADYRFKGAKNGIRPWTLPIGP